VRKTGDIQDARGGLGFARALLVLQCTKKPIRKEKKMAALTFISFYFKEIKCLAAIVR
jgi:hypothetical protein